MTVAPEPSIATIDPTDRSHYRAGVPHDLFTALRSAGAVHRHGTVTGGGEERPLWSVVKHAEVQAVSRDVETFSTADGPAIEPSAMYRDAGMIVALDPPEHLRLRRLISAGFTPRMIARLEVEIATRAHRILDDVVAAGDDVVDLVNDIAFPLPMHVIADIVGIPDADRAWVFSRTNQMLANFGRPDAGSEDPVELQIELFEYAHRLTEEKRERPTDDVWSILTRTELPGVDGSTWSLSGVELEAFFMILTIAGSETTRNALSQGLLELERHPEQIAALRDRPDRCRTAADEVLRWSSPALLFGRTATAPVDLGGQRIEAGDRLVLWYPSANRDEDVFEDPFRFDVARDPNPHVAFGGGGAHVCLGAHLARKEIEVMLGAIVDRFPRFAVAGDPVWSGVGPAHNVGVSIESLPVRLVP